MKKQAIKVQTSNILGPNGEVIPGTLEDIIVKVKKIVLDRNFVPGSKTYQANHPLVKGYLHSACMCTTELVQRGAEKGGLDVDKYNLLTSKTKDFGTKNDYVNEVLAEIAIEMAQDDKDRVELKMDENPEEPITATEQAKLLSEPTEDEDTHVTRIVTKDGGIVDVDKANNKLTVQYTDGTSITMDMVKLETWRQTAMNWLRGFFSSCKKNVVAAVSTVGSFFSKLNPLKLFSSSKELEVEVGEDGTLYYDPAELPEGSVPPRGAVARPKQA